MESDSPFTNREIREMVKDTSNAIARVEGQTTQHNHRMSKMEEKDAERRGELRVLKWVIGAIIIPFMGWLSYSALTVDAKIDETLQKNLPLALMKALEPYNITYEP